MDRRIIEIEQRLAVGERRVVDAVARLDPAYGSTTFDLADGIAVLAGPGLYVNQVMAAGLVADVSDTDLGQLERRADDVGVAPAVDVCELTRADLVARLRARGYTPDDERQVVVHLLEGPRTSGDTPWLIDFAGNAGLREWQEATAAGWGHVEPDRRSSNQP